MLAPPSEHLCLCLWPTWFFGWRSLLIRTGYLVFCLAYSFGVLGVFWHICLLRWRSLYLWKFGIVYLRHEIEHLIFGIVHMVFHVSCGKSTPAGKKYASAAGGAGDKLQLCL